MKSQPLIISYPELTAALKPGDVLISSFYAPDSGRPQTETPVIVGSVDGIYITDTKGHRVKVEGSDSRHSVVRWRRATPEEAAAAKKPTLMDMAGELYARLGGIGSADARIVRGLMERVKELEGKS